MQMQSIDHLSLYLQFQEAQQAPHDSSALAQSASLPTTELWHCLPIKHLIVHQKTIH